MVGTVVRKGKGDIYMKDFLLTREDHFAPVRHQGDHCGDWIGHIASRFDCYRVLAECKVIGVATKLVTLLVATPTVKRKLIVVIPTPISSFKLRFVQQ